MNKYRVYAKLGHVYLAVVEAKNAQAAKEYANRVFGISCYVERVK